MSKMPNLCLNCELQRKNMLNLFSWSHDMASKSLWICSSCWVSHRILTTAENHCLGNCHHVRLKWWQKQNRCGTGIFKMVIIQWKTLTALHKAEKDAKTSSKRVWPLCLLSCKNSITSFRSAVYLVPCQLGACMWNCWESIHRKLFMLAWQ